MHNCPDCDQACYCGGDIDDIDAGDEEAVAACTHCAGGGESDEDVFEDWDVPVW